MITLNVYSISNEKWTLVINGTTPSNLTLTNININYNSTLDPIENPIYIPQFTFSFLGQKNTYDAFGNITYNSHSFTLTNGTNKWCGYLLPDIFTMSNTGYDEDFSLNAISEIEALKYKYFDTTGGIPTNLSIIDYIIRDCISNNTSISATGIDFIRDVQDAFYGYINLKNFCMNDDANDKISIWEAITWILTSLGLRLILNWNNTVTIIALTRLFSQGGNDYSLIKHAGINETFSVAENINSVSVECREARFEFVNIDFKVAETTGDNHPIQIAQGHTFWGTWGHWFQFDRYVGYYKQDSFAGWSFPKYNNPTSAEIPNWWDPSAIFSSFNVPKMGAYPISYRRWNAENPPIYELLTNCLLVKCYNDSSSMLGYNKKYMIYSKQLNAGKGDYIMIDGQFAMSFFAGDANQWYSKSKGNWIIDYRQRAGVWNAGETPKSINNNNWDQCVVPVSPNHENSPLLEGICKSFDWVRISIQFGSLWYNNITDSFTSSTENIFPLSVDGDGLYPNNFYPLQTKKPAADETPKFENVSGFWVELPKGYGTLTVNFYFPNTKTSSPSEVVNYSLLISDLKIQKLNVSSDNYAFTKLNKVYEVGDVSNTVNELKNLKYTVYLGSLKQDNPEVFLSTMYSDMAGKNPIDKLDYSINIPSGGSFSISEKPETHLCRIAYYYFTRMKTITDMINIKDRQLTYTYNSKKLWENGCDISPLNDTITVQYNYNDTTYDS